VLLLSVFAACAEQAPQPTPPPNPQAFAGVSHPATQELRLALIGTSDLHGYVEGTLVHVHDRGGQQRTVRRGGLPLLGGYLDNLRARMPVLLLDAGDMFQGTMVSNQSEGHAVVEAYNILGYQAAAIGNHEFDFGPVGPRAVPSPNGNDDPNGALKARAAEAHYPFLSANLLDKKTDQPVAWPNVHPAVKIEVAGIPIGVIGALSEDTPQTTNSLNLRDVSIGKIVPAVLAQAAALRASGVAAVILTIHEGANCQSFTDPHDIIPCQNQDERILSIVRALNGAVDAVVAGHTHAGVAHFVGDVPIVQSFSYGNDFGRIDLTFRRPAANAPWQVDRTASRIYPPTEVCEVAIPSHVLENPDTPPPSGTTHPPGPRCDAHTLDGTDLVQNQYEGRPLVPNAAVDAVLRPYIEKATAHANTPLGVRLTGRVRRNYRDESAMAQLMADLIRSGASRILGQPVEIAVQNGGGIRNDLPAGAVTYGQVFEVQPFDNRLAILRLTGQKLAEVFRRNLGSKHGVLIPSGIHVEGKCNGAEIQVTLKWENGEPLDLAKTYTIAMSDFLASGGDNFTGITPGETAQPGVTSPVTYYDDVLLRELIVEELTRYHGPLLSGQLQPLRLNFPGSRPLRCPLQPAEPGAPPTSPSSITIPQPTAPSP
jgi:5'-nucleotidase